MLNNCSPMHEHDANSHGADPVQELAPAIVVDVRADQCGHHDDVQGNWPNADASRPIACRKVKTARPQDCKTKYDTT